MIRKILPTLAWTFSLLVAAGGLLIAATPLFGNQALIVRSGSMEPAISVGDIVVVRSSTDSERPEEIEGRPQAKPYEVGQVLSYKLPEHNDMVVTHRIVDASSGAYRTKGDANNEEDSYSVQPEQILGRQLLVVPYVGTLLAFAKTKLGFVSLVVLPALAVIIGETLVIVREFRGKKKVAPESDEVTLPEGTPLQQASPPSEPSPARGYRLPFRDAQPLPEGFSLLPLHEHTPFRPVVDSISRRLTLFLVALAVMSSATWALYSDSGTSSNNVFAAAEDFGGNIADHLVISEVQIQGASPNPTDKDFVEIYNPTSSIVDLSDWSIKKKNAAGTESSIVQISDGKSIPANGFFLWANNALSVGADESNANTIGQNNSVALLAPDDEIVDQVAWGSTSNTQFVEGTAFTPSPDGGQSIERKAQSTSTAASMVGADASIGNGFDTDNNATDFVLRSSSQPQNSSSATETPP